MKVLYITEAHLDRRDGSTTHVLGLCEGLRANGVSVMLVARSGGEINVPEITGRGVGTLLSQRRMFNVLLEHCRRDRPDVILARAEYQTVAAWKLARHLEIPLVTDLNGDLRFQLAKRPLQQQALLRYTEPRLFRESRSIIVTSNAMAERISERTGINRERFKILPMGVSDSFFDAMLPQQTARKQLGWENEKVLLFMGHLNEWQGVAALAPLQNQGKLVIVGDGPMRAELEELMPGATFTGSILHDQIPIYLSGADLLLQPPRHPDHVGMPTRIAEYLAAGKPILASDAHETERDLAASGCLLLGDFKTAPPVKDLDGIGERGRNYARANLTWDSIGRSLKGILFV